MKISPNGDLDGKPLADGDALELLASGGRWVPAVWKSGGLALILGGEWESDPDGTPIEQPLADPDLARIELRRAEAPARATRVLALSQFLTAQAPEVKPDDPIDMSVARANREYMAELPRAILGYQERLRQHSFELFFAATQLSAARATGNSGESEREQLEQAALQFAETSRWLSALQLMQADVE